MPEKKKIAENSDFKPEEKEKGHKLQNENSKKKLEILILNLSNQSNIKDQNHNKQTNNLQSKVDGNFDNVDTNYYLNFFEKNVYNVSDSKALGPKTAPTTNTISIFTKSQNLKIKLLRKHLIKKIQTRHYSTNKIKLGMFIKLRKSEMKLQI